MSDVPILFTASGDSSTSMWDVSTNQKISTFVGHSGSVKSIDIKPKDQGIVCILKALLHKIMLPVVTRALKYFNTLSCLCYWIKRWQYRNMGH